MKKNVFENIVGIDISKDTFDVALLKNSELEESNKFTNDVQGHKKMFSWLKSKKINIKNVLFCAEKTGVYSIRLTKYLSDSNCKLWLEDPIKISKSDGFKRGKNDKIDSVRIAKYALRYQDNLQLWTPGDEIYDKMNHLFSLRERLINVLGILEKPLFETRGIFDTKLQEVLENICFLPIMFLKLSIKRVDKKLDNLLKENEEIRRKYKIITSVRGIGKQTAIYLLIISRGFTKIKTARSCSCYCGVAPFEYSSGTSIKGKTKISVYGNKKLKKLLHMGAVSIIGQKKGDEYDYYCRKVNEDGKHKMSVINTLRNKMLSRVFACIKGDREYEENYKKVV